MESGNKDADVKSCRTILIYGVTWIGSIGYYYFKGRHEYKGPVAYITKEA